MCDATKNYYLERNIYSHQERLFHPNVYTPRGKESFKVKILLLQTLSNSIYYDISHMKFKINSIQYREPKERRGELVESKGFYLNPLFYTAKEPPGKNQHQPQKQNKTLQKMNQHSLKVPSIHVQNCLPRRKKFPNQLASFLCIV